MNIMIFIYLLIAAATGLGMWAVVDLFLVGHVLEAGSLLILMFFSLWCALEFAKRTPRSTGLTFVGVCLALSLQMAAHMAGGMPPDALWAWLNFGLLFVGGPLYLDWVTRFPMPRPELRWLVVLAYGVAGALAVTGALGLLGPAFDPMHPLARAAREMHFLGGEHSHSGGIPVFGVMELVGLGVLWSTRRKARMERAPRVAHQALVVMLGTLFTWVPTVAYLPGVLPEGLEMILHGPPALFFILLPIAGTSALRHPEFHDDRGLFRRWLVAVGVVSGTYLAYIALVRPLTLLLDQVRPGFGREPAVFGAALVCALLVRPFTEWMKVQVDRIFYPHLLGFRTLLQEVSQALATTIIPHDVARLATESLPARLGIPGAALLVLDDLDTNLVSLSGAPLVISEEHALWDQAYRAGGPTMLQDTMELGLEAPALMLPLRVGGRLVGIYVLGARQPWVNYSREELGQLMVLEHHLAIAVENGRALRKIDALSQRALAEVEERNRLAREIHDTIAQGLTAAGLQLDVVEATLTSNPAKAAKATARAQSIVRANLEEARRSVLELRAPLLGSESLPAALSRLLNQAAIDIGAAGSFQVEGSYRGVPARIETQFYRIAQEALHNAVKYSNATHLTVRLQVGESQISLSIADDGVGFDSAKPARGNGRGGFGLTGMGERARLLEGQLRIVSEPGEGTLVEAFVPLRHEEGESA